MSQPSLPDFLIIGAPKAGSTALHGALATHSQLFGSAVKEPKYFLSPDRRPDPRGHRGPGDSHSAKEWIWRRDDYEQLFASAPSGTLRFESTPFYLWDKASHATIARTLGDHAKLIAVIRDPVDRAFSNWSHLRADGLEPEADFFAACRDEQRRVEAGWAPFWRYLELGRYGEQLEHLFRHVSADRVRVIRYRRLIDDPAASLDELCEFLGVQIGQVDHLPDANVGRWTAENAVNNMLRRVVAIGADLGARVPPVHWRRLERPLLALMQRGQHPRPRLDPATRAALVGEFAADNALLSRLLGADYSDWLQPDAGRGMYTVRRS